MYFYKIVKSILSLKVFKTIGARKNPLTSETINIAQNSKHLMIKVKMAQIYF